LCQQAPSLASPQWVTCFVFAERRRACEVHGYISFLGGWIRPRPSPCMLALDVARRRRRKPTNTLLRACMDEKWNDIRRYSQANPALDRSLRTKL